MGKCMQKRIKYGIFLKLYKAKAFDLVFYTDAHLINLKGQPSKFVEVCYIFNIKFSIPNSYSTDYDNNLSFKIDSLTS